MKAKSLVYLSVKDHIREGESTLWAHPIIVDWDNTPETKIRNIQTFSELIQQPYITPASIEPKLVLVQGIFGWNDQFGMYPDDLEIKWTIEGSKVERLPWWRRFLGQSVDLRTHSITANAIVYHNLEDKLVCVSDLGFPYSAAAKDYTGNTPKPSTFTVIFNVRGLLELDSNAMYFLGVDDE